MKWYENSYRRCLVDMHIPDWDERFLAEFDSKRYIEAMKTAGVDAAYIYANSCVGICNWPTKTGHRHKGLIGRDIIRELTEGLAKEGIKPIVYINFWSIWAYNKYPEWRCIDQKGRGSKEGLWGRPSRHGLLCMNSPYSDYVLQLVDELCSSYDFVGFWVDMILWRMMCYCPHCRKRFRDETGYELPEKVDWKDPVWLTYLRKREEWNEEIFSRIIARVKKWKPEATVMCNSSYYPWYILGESMKFYRLGEFIGGDFSMKRLPHSFECKLFNSVSAHKPFEFLCSVMDPALGEHSVIKSDEHLQTLMFSTLANNGRYGFIDAIDPSGMLNPRVYKRMHKIFEIEKQYEKYLRNEVRFVQDVGLYTNLDSYTTPIHNGTRVVDVDIRSIAASPHMNGTQETALNLMNQHIPFGVLTPYDLDNLDTHKVLIISNLCVMTEEECEKLRSFVKKGGCLYASGEIARYDKEGQEILGGALADMLGVRLLGQTSEKITYMRPMEMGKYILEEYTDTHPLTVNGPQMLVEAQENTVVLAKLTLPWVHPEDPARFASAISNPPGQNTEYPSIVLSNYGKGKVIYSAGQLEMLHKPDHVIAFVRLLELFKKHAYSFETNAPHCMELTMYEQKEEGRYILNLLNRQEILPSVPVHDIEVYIHVPQKIKTVRMLPEEKEIPFTIQNEQVCFCLDKVNIFQMMALEYDICLL